MKQKRLFLALLMFVLLLGAISPQTTVAGEKLSQTIFTPTIDGDISDWASVEKYYIADPVDDSVLNANHELYGIYIAMNETHLFVALDVALNNGTVVYFDTDPGQGTGLTDVQNSAGYGNRPITLGGGFAADFFVGVWDAGTPAVFNGSDNGAYLGDSGFGGFYAVASSTNNILEISLPFSMLYGGTNVTGKSIGILPVKYSWDGFTAVDYLPNDPSILNLGPNDPVTLTNYIKVDLDSDGDGISNLQAEPTAGWFGNVQANLINGSAAAGLPLSFSMEVWWNVTDSAGIHDHPNMTYGVNAQVVIRDDQGVVTLNETQKMVHKPGEYSGNNDIYRLVIPGSSLIENYNVTVTFWPDNWDPTHSWQGEKITKSYLVGPPPTTFNAWVGGVIPSGGFTAPNEDLRVEAQANWKVNGTDITIHDDPTDSLPVDVFLYYSINGTEPWVKVKMDYVKSFTDNDLYEVYIPAQNENTTVTFYVNATATANFNVTANVTVIFGIEPPKTLIYNQLDPKGDEFGEYPSADAFAPYFGHFDILEFNVSANDYNVQFSLEFLNLSFNGWGGPNGFSHPIITIYIDNAAGGETSTIRKEYVDIEQAHAWEYVVVADGWTQELHSATAPEDAIPGAGVVVKGDASTGIVDIVVPVNQIGTPVANWSYVVLVGSGDFNYFRNRGASAGEWAFGGGDDSDFDPNVVDMLVPSSGNLTFDAEIQDFLLNNYDVATQTRATVYAVGEEITFEEDTTNPTAEILSPADGDTFDADATTGKATVTLKFKVSDADQGLLAGLKLVRIFDNQTLIKEINLNGLTYEETIEIQLEAGVHNLKVLVFDVSGNFADATVQITVVGPTTSAEKKGGFLPMPIWPFLVALAAIPLLRKRIKR